MEGKEHRDVYIAMGVGGLGLVLIFLYLNGQTATPTVYAADGTPLPSVVSVASPSDTPYNYNVSPYVRDPGLPFAIGDTTINAGGGCCDKCGPQDGSQYFNPNVSQYQTLI